jgi:8-oxo-dGTP diphosphatase
MKVADIDWAAWEPTEHATLLFVIRDGLILLIHKKRGLGAGKINGPGGRIDPGETAHQCAVREVQEELLVTPTGVTFCGTLKFQFVDGYSIQGEVFRATDCEGEPTETDEAIPLWYPLDDLPFDAMWEDDPIWFPHLLANRRFEGRFTFDEDTMLDHVVETG